MTSDTEKQEVLVLSAA